MINFIFSLKGLLNEFVVFYYDVAWKRVDETYTNLANNEVTAKTSHFTTFVLTAMPVSTGTAVPEAPANIYDDYPSGIGGSCGADFTIIDENFKYYMDRDYYVRPTSASAINQTTFDALGFYGALGIATANGYSGSGINLGPQSAHKLYTGDDYVTFMAHKDLDVYVMYDTRGGSGVMDISQDAPWLASQGFTADITTTAIPTPTRYFIETTDAVGRYTVYRKSYNTGEVVHLHGNRKGVTDPAINTNYWIILKSKGVYTNEPASTMSSTPDTTPPANVTGLTASVTSGHITLSWTNPTDADFAGVVIRKSTTAFPIETNEGIEPVGAELSETSYRDDDVGGVTTYYYTVFALDTNQNYQSGGTTKQVNYNDSEINVVQGATTILSGGSYDFGDILVGNSSGNITFTIQNTGTSPLSISSVALSGTNSDQFTLNDSSTASTVSAGSSTTFTLAFNPDSLGTKNALITINNGDSDEGTYTINITGAGFIPDTTSPAEVTDLTAMAGDTQVTLSWTDPADADFDHVEITSTPATSTYTVAAGVETKTITGLTNGTAYTFTVKTVDTTGNKSAGESTSATPADTFSVTYDANGATGGSVPIDATAYSAGDTVTVLGNTGSLVKTCKTFNGWNTASNGSGIAYTAGETFTIGSSDVTLYAQWANILYVTYFNSSIVTYFNATTGAYLNGTLANSSFTTGSYPWGVAVNTSANILYVVNGSSNTVTYFNATTGAYLNGTLANSSFATGSASIGVAVNTSANILYVTNGGSKVTYFNATTGAYLNGTLANSSFATGSYPEGVAVNPSANILYVANRNSNTVTYFNAATGAYLNGTLANSSFATGYYPRGVAVNLSANILYVTNADSNTVTYFNAATGAYPIRVAVNASANILYVTNYHSNTVTYYNAATGAYLNGTLANSSFTTGSGPYGVAVSE